MTTTQQTNFKEGDWIALDEEPAMRQRDGMTTVRGKATQIDKREAQLLNAAIRDVLVNQEEGEQS